MTTATTDRFGFPIETCGRCGGTGQHSYNQMHGSRCYGCNGHGLCHTRKAARHFVAWRNDLQALRHVAAADLKPGDELAVYGDNDIMQSKPIGWRTVAATQRTDKVCGWRHVRTDGGAELKLPTAWTFMVTFEDGTTETSATNAVYRRKGWIDPSPYVAAATTSRRPLPTRYGRATV